MVSIAGYDLFENTILAALIFASLTSLIYYIGGGILTSTQSTGIPGAVFLSVLVGTASYSILKDGFQAFDLSSIIYAFAGFFIVPTIARLLFVSSGNPLSNIGFAIVASVFLYTTVAILTIPVVRGLEIEKEISYILDRF